MHISMKADSRTITSRPVVPNQRAWRMGEPINDVTGVDGAAQPERVEADRTGRFTVKVWDRPLQQRGVYDLVAHVPGDAARPRTVAAGDIISYLKDKGYSEFRKEGLVIEGWPVQFLPAADDLDAEALARAEEVEVEMPSGGR